jgi:hypothetical protein
MEIAEGNVDTLLQDYGNSSLPGVPNIRCCIKIAVFKKTWPVRA